jgi:mannose-1-phosphate guanylyltransferase
MSEEIRTAFVLGAGLGTRLKALTARCPKPLIPVCNKRLITFAFDHLLACGVERLVINTHHCPEVYSHVFPEREYRGAPLVLRNEPVLLETAGGIGNVADLLGNDPFIVYNGDILTDLPLEGLIAHHLEMANEVTLGLRSDGGPLHIAFDEITGRVVDIRNRLGTGRESRCLFAGVYAVSPQFLRRIPPGEKISVVPIFLKMIQEGAKLGGIVLDEGRWWDLGTREEYLKVHRALRDSPGGFRGLRWVDSNARIASDASISDASSIGPGCVVAEGARLSDSILWEGAKVAAQSVLDNCIVTVDRTVSGKHSDRDF